MSTPDARLPAVARRLLMTLALCLFLPAHASVLAPDGNAHEYPLLSSMTLLEDVTGQLDLETVDSTAYADRFVPAALAGPNYGFREGALWFRVQIDFSSAREQPWFLVESHPIIDDIRFFMPDAQTRWRVVALGDTLPFAQRLVDHREFIVPVDNAIIHGPQPARFYIRIAGEGALNVGLNLSAGQALIERTNTETAIFGLFFGAMLLVALFHFSLWLGGREPAQLHYVVMVLGLTLLFVSINGYGLQYLWPDTPALNRWFPVFAFIAMIGGMQFTRSFLDIAKSNPRLDLFMRVFTGALLVMLVAVMLMPRQWAYQTGVASPVMAVALMFGAGVLRLRQGYEPSRLFVAGWAICVTGAALTALGNFGILKGMVFPLYAAQIGTALLVMLLSLALGERLRFLKKDNESIRQELARSTQHDALTGLPNRFELEKRLPDALAQSHDKELALAVLYIDIDDFKAVNDAYGHETGDRLLAEIAARLQKALEGQGILTRFGGDEFVVVQPYCESAEDALLTAHNVIASVSRPVLVNGMPMHLSCCIGISIGEATLENPMQLIQEADIALQKAKQGGHNNFALHTTDMNTDVTQRIQLRNEMIVAQREGQFVVHYQPIIDSRSGKPCGFEALLRWNHPVRGRIPASEFIAIAEETGHIVQLGEWVLKTACADCAGLLRTGLRTTKVSVNISSIQFQREDFVDSVTKALDLSALAAEHLELEITETVMLHRIGLVRENIEKLRKLGVGVSIDDFGTGYSSLSDLRNLPVNKIKIDELFIRNVISNSHDAAITRAIISIARHLNLNVLAEGIESQAQCDFLQKCGCDQFQGYFFSPALPLPELAKYLLARRETGTNENKPTELPQETVLLVDDEPNILKALSRVLRHEGYRILHAESAQDAFVLLAQNEVNLIISDQRMPKMSGTEFLAQVKDIYPDTIRIVLSGYTDLKSVTDAVNQGAIYRFLTKPWDDEALRNEVRQALRRGKTLAQP